MIELASNKTIFSPLFGDLESGVRATSKISQAGGETPLWVMKHYVWGHGFISRVKSQLENDC